MPATFSIIGLALNLMGVIVLFRYGMPYRVRTEGDTGSATVLDVEHHNLGLFGLGAAFAKFVHTVCECSAKIRSSFMIGGMILLVVAAGVFASTVAGMLNDGRRLS